MSWTYDFGEVASAAELRAHDVRARVSENQVAPRLPAELLGDQKADVRREEIKATARAVYDHICAARDAAAAIIDSPAFAEHRVRVFASGQANPRHEPIAIRSGTFEVEARGETVEVVEPIAPAALEQITVTLTQVPPDPEA